MSEVDKLSRLSARDRAIVDAYSFAGRSYEGALIHLQLEGVDASFATVQRTIQRADSMGVVEKREKGRPRDKRERAKEVLRKFPGRPMWQLANLAECSEHTIYRAQGEIDG